ncbi:MAG: helix-turn-helix transcriptional regulator [Kangiellaceae bacterium]|nr:helix-turn-helix transcriptional regulator [Kangiellaceae bacterium]MCW8998419.1 helix-turn-helix transcriptional regulator [Kangiellaceae bacterium]MCW9018134.1 helix-turn-helix transcriptional regulator [Kangiellaceae bacterium]
MNSTSIPFTKSIQLLDFYLALEAHDWTYVYSSDRNAYLSGQVEAIRLAEIAEACPLAKALYIQFRLYVFEGRAKPAKPLVFNVLTNNRRRDFLERLNSSLDRLYANSEISVRNIANMLAMSERQLFRKTKANLNVTPTEYLKLFRLEKAKSMLDNNKSSTEATYSSGFSSQSYFCKCFKSQFGVSPSEYKKLRQRAH